MTVTIASAIYVMTVCQANRLRQKYKSRKYKQDRRWNAEQPSAALDL